MSDIERVPFHGDFIEAIRDDQGVWLPIKTMCATLGLNANGQRERLQRQPWAVARVMRATGSDGKSYEMFCVSIDTLPSWLHGLESTRIKDAALRTKIVRYQLEAHRVLVAHFLPRVQPQPEVVTYQAPHPAVHGARIGDTAEGRATVLRHWRHAAWGSPDRRIRYSMQKIGGLMRRWGHVSSPYSIALCDWPFVANQLHELEMGRWPFVGHALPPAKPANGRQPELPFLSLVKPA